MKLSHAFNIKFRRFDGLAKSVTTLTLALTLSACGSVNLEEMTQLDGEQAREALAGNTVTNRTEYGRWARYYSEGDLSGTGRAWGDWGKEEAQGTTKVGSDGEVCTTYIGSHDWATADKRYCFFILQDADGNYLDKITRQDNKPNRVGKVSKFTIVEGDEYGLTN